MFRSKYTVSYKTYSIQDFVLLPIYVDQREPCESKIKVIAAALKKKILQGSKVLCITDPCIARHPSKQNVFSYKNMQVYQVLFDGQHRLRAFDVLLLDPDVKEQLSKYKITVKMFPCSTEQEVHSLFLDLNQSESAVGVELKQNKSLFNTDKTIKDALKQLKNDYKGVMRSDVKHPKRTTFGKFYYQKLTHDMITYNPFIDWIEKYKIDPHTLYAHLKELQKKFIPLTLQPY